MDSYTRPRPNPDPEAVPYWQSLRDHALAVQHCVACDRYYFPPADRCATCLSAEVSWAPVSGLGAVWSHVTMHRVYRPDYERDVPYNIAIVELDEGPKLWTNVVDIDPADVVVGLRVRVRYDDVTDDLTLARFVPNR
ncbi:MAG: Zn-ribbon domain-containing OB-fold protein [Streptosporangiaceae bacterium]